MNKDIGKIAHIGGRALKKKYGLIYFKMLAKRSVIKRKELRNARQNQKVKV